MSYTFQLRQHSVRPSYALIIMVSVLTAGLSLRLLCPDLSDPSSLTERTSVSVSELLTIELLLQGTPH